MRVEWTTEFDRWLTAVEEQAEAGDPLAGRKLDYIAAQLQLLTELDAEPEEESAQLKLVRQKGRHPVWRVSHGFDPEIAMRLICWFPPRSRSVVVTVFVGDKKKIGDAFYSSVGPRADAEIDRWLMHYGHELEAFDTGGDDDDLE